MDDNILIRQSLNNIEGSIDELVQLLRGVSLNIAGSPAGVVSEFKNSEGGGRVAKKMLFSGIGAPTAPNSLNGALAQFDFGPLLAAGNKIRLGRVGFSFRIQDNSAVPPRLYESFGQMAITTRAVLGSDQSNTFGLPMPALSGIAEQFSFNNPTVGSQFFYSGANKEIVLDYELNGRFMTLEFSFGFPQSMLGGLPVNWQMSCAFYLELEVVN